LTLLSEPRVGVRLRHHGEDLDLLALHVVEDPQLADAEPILRVGQPPKAFDAALAHPGRLVPQMHFHRVAHLGPVASTQATQVATASGARMILYAILARS
jgi:hypothetical protein